ncbi:MAG TPA: CPBP family intramembrane metalloprotease, partial [Planctomycetaceae bacterium]|nr:CPBP family intramembrane metalloprotease [Planctomycetaceae bacterium]
MEPLHSKTSILRPVEIFVIFIVTFFLMLLFGVAMTLLWGSKTATLLGEFLIIVPGLSYVWFKRLPSLRVFRIHRINYAVLLYTFFIAIPLFILSDELDRLISSIFPMPEIFIKGMEEFVKIHSFGDAVILFVAAVLMAGVAEEMLFRGLLQRSLEFHLEPAMAIVISAAFFAVVHLNPWMALQITFLGLVFGWMAWK